MTPSSDSLSSSLSSSSLLSRYGWAGCAGTLIAVTRKAGIVDAQGRIPKGRTNMAFLVDSVGTIIGSCLGTSTVTTYVESASGIVDGGRTGVVALVVGIWFALAVPFAPVISQIPDLGKFSPRPFRLRF